MIHRIIEQRIKNDFNKGDIITLMGARQVGKTTLYETIVDGEEGVLWLNCDDYDDRAMLGNKTSSELRQLIGEHRIVVIDEAQKVKNIGLTLKMIADLKLSTQVLVTGSSSLTLADEVNEPATGRLIEHRLFPLSLAEMSEQASQREERRLLEQRMIYGLYPKVVHHFLYQFVIKNHSYAYCKQRQ